MESRRDYNFYKFRVRNLVVLRNEILNAYTDMKKAIEGSKAANFPYYEKSDAKKLFTLFDRLKQTHYLTPHYLWDI